MPSMKIIDLNIYFVGSPKYDGIEAGLLNAERKNKINFYLVR